MVRISPILLCYKNLQKVATVPHSTNLLNLKKVKPYWNNVNLDYPFLNLEKLFDNNKLCSEILGSRQNILTSFEF